MQPYKIPTSGTQSQGASRERGGCYPMADAGVCPFRDKCKFSHDIPNTEEGTSRIRNVTTSRAGGDNNTTKEMVKEPSETSGLENDVEEEQLESSEGGMTSECRSKGSNKCFVRPYPGSLRLGLIFCS